MRVFSTCWNGRRHTDGAAMIDEILALGFDRVELSHGMSVSLLPGILGRVKEKAVTVAGLHNFFPAPLDVRGDSPDAFQFTSHRPAERRRALDLSKRTIDQAASFGARYVVLHMGSVPLFRSKDGSRLLEARARRGFLDSREYAELKGKIVRRRRRLAPLYVERALIALRELADYAGGTGVTLGVEARSHLEQVPDEEEMELFMREFADVPHVGYWHDFGHVQRKHNLLLLDHRQFLERMRPYLVGGHVNDVRWPDRDHRVPFDGGVDFEGLCALFTPEMPLTWELSSSRSAGEIAAAAVRWEALIGK
ncbi:MAG: sugar phosphate isomerase/epimerase [Akkermansiaceae bacterium]|nr:sugar phosphate isomerase/epimerase [Akkermansiaceae bacterium]MCD8070114.1 sugar phosphate isomerase/epimerase [Akkermansiaceae bacterium]